MAQNSTKTVTYADAGVDIDRGNRTKQRIKYLAHKTFTKGVLSEIGGFGGLFAIDKKKFLDPVLVSSVDGVGTKLKLAFDMDLAPHRRRRPGEPLRQRHRRARRDAHVLHGLPRHWQARARSRRKGGRGLADACKHNGCALIGGETAEMPGFYPEGEYDLAGFIVGVVERDKIITGKDVEAGDVSSACPPTGCTPTATRWPASCFRSRRIHATTPTSTKSKAKSATS